MKLIAALLLSLVLAVPASAATRHRDSVHYTTDATSGCSISDAGNPACGIGTIQGYTPQVTALDQATLDAILQGLVAMGCVVTDGVVVSCP